MGDVISSEISKLGRGTCKQHWSGTGLQLLVTANKLCSPRNNSAPALDNVERGSPSIITECNYGLLHHCQGAGALSLLDTMEGGKLGQCVSFGVWTPQIIYSAMGTHSEASVLYSAASSRAAAEASARSSKY